MTHRAPLDDEDVAPGEADAGEEGVLNRPFAVLPEAPCPYLPGLYERKLVTDLSGVDAAGAYNVLSRAGFRRSHRFAYRPACRACSACIPARVVAPEYRRSKNLKRVASKNADLQATLAPPVATPEQFALFARYMDARHAGGEMADMTFGEFVALIEETAVRTRVAELRRPDGELAGACILDLLDDGVSAVYSFYDPGMPGRSLGTHIIDWLIHFTARRNRRHVYLGYWVPQAPKMAYKRRFQPLEVRVGGVWQRLDRMHGPVTEA